MGATASCSDSGKGVAKSIKLGCIIYTNSRKIRWLLARLIHVSCNHKDTKSTGNVMLRDKNDSIVISYIWLRRLIGGLGMLLPLFCISGGKIFAGLSWQQSISYYYYTNMRDFFVGLLFCVSMFLITYKGYEKIDTLITTASGISGLCIAIFPCHFESDLDNFVGIFQIESHISNIIHLTFASFFFLLLAINSIFLFTLSDKSKTTFSKNKKFRNKIYVCCGAIILLSMALVALLLLSLSEEMIKQYKIVLSFETIMLVAFGISWLIKGETLFTD